MNHEASENTHPSFHPAGAEERVRKLQTVRAGSLHFGIFADEIATTCAWQKPTPLPHAPQSVLGVVSIQGRMLTVLDLAILSGHEAAPSDALDGKRCIIALRGDEQLALAVDALGKTVDVPERDVQPTQQTAGTFVFGILQLKDAEVKILNLKELFPAAIQGRQRRKRRF